MQKADEAALDLIYMDDEIDLLSGRGIDLEILEHIPRIKNEPKAMAVVTELVAKFPNMEIEGVMSEEMEAKVWEMRIADLSPAEQLAVVFDRLSYDYDTILYHDSTRNMTENVSELAERIRQGDTEHLTDWLKAIISEGAVPEEADRAKELLEKLAEYKPLQNVLKNAVAYSDRGSVITISVYYQKENAIINVSNTGDTILPEQQAHIFEKFYRADEARQGNTGGAGLGLAIAKNIIVLHGGTIAVESQERKTTFTITLPDAKIQL